MTPFIVLFNCYAVELNCPIDYSLEVAKYSLRKTAANYFIEQLKAR